MARAIPIVVLSVLLFSVCCQAQGVPESQHGLALPTAAPADSDIGYNLADIYADDDYFEHLERQEMMFIDDLIAEQEQQTEMQAEELSAILPSRAASPGYKQLQAATKLPVSTVSTPVDVSAAASNVGRDVRAAMEQAQKLVSQLLRNKGEGIKSSTQYIDGAPVNVVELATGGASGLSGDNDIQIDVTVTTERSGLGTWMLPSIFPTNIPFFGASGWGSSSNSESEADKQGMQLAAELTQSVIEQALANRAAGLTGDQELVLDMSVENATPQTTEKLVAAAAAAAATAAASGAFGNQPFESLELQMEVVETTVPFFKSGRFYVAAMLLLSLQLLLCLAVALLWNGDEDEEADEDDDESADAPIEYVEIDLHEQKRQAQLEYEQRQARQQQQQQQRQQSEWEGLAEEGRGLYEKLLSYT